MSQTSTAIAHDVRRALVDDPRLPCADEIAVEAYDRVVTLRGTVGSFAHKRAAVADARRAAALAAAAHAPGVAEVHDRITVRAYS